MSNMNYCRFQNTVSDVADCLDNWDVESKDEGFAKIRLLKQAARILGQEGYMLNFDEFTKCVERLTAEVEDM